MDRRSFLLFPLAALPVAGYARYVEPSWLELAHESIMLPGLRKDDPVRLVQLSDLHASDVVPQSLIEQAIDLALAQKPDLICFTGDYITEGKGYDPEWYRRVLRHVSSAVPCFATLGNHDGGAWSGKPGVKPYSTESILKLLAASRIPVLMNESREIRVRSQQFHLVGVGDYWARDCDPEAAFRSIRSEGGPTVVLSHNPDSKFDMDEYPWHLMLSGHTHGGQVVVPVLGYSPAPVVDRRYIKGLKPWNNHLIYVSAGIGNIEGFRFNCRPQVNLIELHG